VVRLHSALLRCAPHRLRCATSDKFIVNTQMVLPALWQNYLLTLTLVKEEKNYHPLKTEFRRV
jgi:hypothetical protein